MFTIVCCVLGRASEDGGEGLLLLSRWKMRTRGCGVDGFKGHLGTMVVVGGDSLG